jgi:PKD repeat protein/glucose/arabinose dehydrogenase/type 1 glutamine amidotransferase
VALASLLLVVPATAHARKAAAADPYKVLVVTSTSDALTAAGVDAITTAGAGIYTVTAPAPAEVGGQFTPEGLDQYRAVVFLNTGMASPLNDAQRAAFEAYYKKGGGFVGIGSAVETDAAWPFMNDLLGARSSGRTASQSGTIKVADRVHEASKDLPRYWDRTEAYYNFTANVRGVHHVLATVVEDPFEAQPQGNPVTGIADGTMGFDHPVSWCRDYQNGRSFYTALGGAVASYDADLGKHLKGAINWAAGQADPVYSDCGATVLRNYQQTKLSAPPNLNEPIGFDQLPDGRIIQTARTGTVRLHDPVKGTTTVLADFQSPTAPASVRLYTVSEDGLYGPGLDNNFEQNKWVYLFYSPSTVTDVKLSTGQVVTQTTPTTNPPANAASKTAWDPWVGYFQLSRFKFVDGETPSLDLSSEQQILRVPVNRGNCCHVAGDIDFDKHNNLWIVTGDDNEAGGINGGGFGPFNDQLTDENQTVRVTNATGGTFTLTFNGQTTAPLPYNASAAQVDEALEALSNIEPNEVQSVGGPVNTANVNVYFRRGLQQANQNQITADGAALTGGTIATATAQEGGYFQNPIGDSRRGALNTNDLRGKVIRINVKDAIGAADANKADFGSGTGAYTIPAGNLFPLVAGAPQAKTRPEVYAMGFRNPFRIQVDENDVAYVTDYSPDSRTQTRGRGPAGTGRVEIIRKPSNYGWPTCYSSKLGYWKWNFHEWAPTVPVTPAPGNNVAGMPPNGVPEKIDCGGPTQRNDSHWVRDGGPSVEPGLQDVPPVTDPDIWYSYNDNLAPNPLGTPCAAYTELTPGPIAPGSTTECPRLFPELGSGGNGAHGAAKYNFDANNPNPKKFPPYYDDTVIMGEFTRDFLREIKLDEQNRIQKISNFLDCGAANVANSPFLFECDNPMDMQFGSDGAFYLLTYGDGFFSPNADAGMYKWEYAKGQRAPKAVLNVDRDNGPSPLTVNFSSAGSLDDDPGESIRFEWDFGDGSPLSLEANPTHTYTAPGRYTAVLTVIDSSDKRTSVSRPITVGNTIPEVTVEVPVKGGTFAFGEKIPFVVKVTDAEDGNAKCEDIQVTFVLGHDTHGHAEDTKTGCSGFLSTIADDVSHGGNVFGIITAQYTDKGGSNGQAPSLTAYGQTEIRQRKQEVEHVVTQSGTNTANTSDIGGGLHRGSISNNDWVQLNGPFNLHQIESVTFRYADGPAGRTAGSPLAAIEVRQDSITGPLLATANLPSTGGPTVWANHTIPLSMSGLHEVFLVFRSVTGGAPSNNNPGMLFLNFAEFNGQGITVINAPADGTVSGNVPATLSLTLGGPATFAPFLPGVGTSYTATTSANVISSAGDAALSVADPSSNATGRLVNGAFSLAQAVEANAGGAFAPVGGSATPTLLKSWTGPTSNEAVTINFSQTIGASEPLRTGAYSKTLTFTLSTTNP